MSASHKIRDRIRRLREMTSARGCTEAEAVSAAEKAAQLMRDHGLSDADIVMDEVRGKARNRGQSVGAKLYPIIAYCTNTQCIFITGRKKTEQAFIGRAPGPDIAVYLRDVCDRAVDHGVRRFKLGKVYRRRRTLATKRQAVADFTEGFVLRLSHRLLDIFGPSIDKGAQEAANAAMVERYGEGLPIEHRHAPDRYSEARARGWRDAGDVTLAAGVGGAANAPLQIGGAS